MKMTAKTGVMRPQAKECWKPRDAGRGQRETLPWSLQREGSSGTWISENTLLGLPWWHSGWESACQCRGHGFEPWSGKIPHAAEQLGP